MMKHHISMRKSSKDNNIDCESYVDTSIKAKTSWFCEKIFDRQVRC